MAVTDTAAIAAFGLVLVDAPAPPPPPLCEVWAELWPAVQIFIDVRGQWRAGPGGAYALDHAALPAHARPGRNGRRGRRNFCDLQVMEQAALDWFAEQREKPAGAR